MLNTTPGNSGDAMLELRRRIEALERPKSVMIGQWIIHQSQYGDLVADNMNTGERSVIAAYDKSKKTGPLDPPVNKTRT